MMEFKGTQGPWETLVADSGNAVRVFAGDSIYIGMIGGSDQSHVEISRNARLIAAAPELLESLLVMLSLVRIKYGNLSNDVAIEMDKADAAIDKALGKQ